MAQYQGRQDPTRQTDEYGNPIRQGDEYGNMNPVRQAQTTGLYGTGMGGAGGETGSHGLGTGGGAQYQGRQDPTRQTDEYGNPIRQGDEYGNVKPVRQAQTTGLYGTGMGGVGGETGSHGLGAGGGTGSYGLGAGGGGQGQQLRMGQQHHAGEGGGVLQRSGSGSSSSEDDGQGGRRKKGLKEKVKEKIPGVGGGDEYGRHRGATHVTPNTTGTGGYGDPYYQGGQQEESKGIMDKIKEKLPGHH